MLALDKNLIIDCRPNSHENRQITQHLKNRLHNRTGIHLQNSSNAAGTCAKIQLIQEDLTDLGPEGYRLEITDSGILLNGTTAGLLYACEALAQLAEEKDDA